MTDYSIEIINNQAKLENLVERLAHVSFFALDIETAEWWIRHRERISLIQIAFYAPGGGGRIKVVIIDALAGFDLKILSVPLQSSSAIKIIHNAAFDATRLFNHYKFKTAPIHDTMLAARRNGEKKYSLQAQSIVHLNLRLDKGTQRSDWSRRPLDFKQISYAALDSYAALRLYEHQLKRNLNGTYHLRDASASGQGQLPLDDLTETVSSATKQEALGQSQSAITADTNSPAQLLPVAVTALLGIISQLPSRYGPDQLAVSVGSERVGLAGWIVDRLLGRETDFDEDNARLVIADLIARKLIKFTATRRLEATQKGLEVWLKIKPNVLK
jgi:hypothetical protein